MIRVKFRAWLAVGLSLLAGPRLYGNPGPVDASSIIPFLSEWKMVEHIPLQFDAHHTQGLVKIDSKFYLSSVEVVKKSAAEGVGHLYEFDQKGALLREIRLGEGITYHPGGMDFDGKSIWVPVAEYKPKSHSVIYKVDPKTLQAVQAFQVEDHIGALVYNREFDTVVGMNWNAEHFYEWKADGRLLRKVKNERNINYQDCKFVQGPAMLCSGVIDNAQGQLDVIDLFDFTRVTGMWAIPRTRKRILVTRNPMAVEQIGDKLLYYFIPEDHFGTVYVYELR